MKKLVGKLFIVLVVVCLVACGKSTNTIKMEKYTKEFRFKKVAIDSKTLVISRVWCSGGICYCICKSPYTSDNISIDLELCESLLIEN